MNSKRMSILGTKGMNKPEKTLFAILANSILFLKGFNFNPWVYTGNAKFFVSGKNPDFTYITGEAVIELYGDYWHRNENPEDRINFFKRHGIACLVIWEHELKDKETVLNRVNEFSLKFYEPIISRIQFNN